VKGYRHLAALRRALKVEMKRQEKKAA